MKNKKLMLDFVILIFLANFSFISIDVFAFDEILDNDLSLLAYWELDNASDTMADSKDNGLDRCDLYYDGGIQLAENIAPYSEYSLGFSDNYAKNGECMNNFMRGMDEFTILFWLNANWEAEKSIMGWYDTSIGENSFTAGTKTGNINIQLYHVPSNYLLSGEGKDGSLYTFMFNGTAYILLRNLTVLDFYESTTSLIVDPLPNEFTIGRTTSGYGNGFTGNYDDIAVFNKSLSYDEINEYLINGISIHYYCLPNRVNSTPSIWLNISDCFYGNYTNKSRYFIEYDLNSCNGSLNNTYYEYDNDYCLYIPPITPIYNISLLPGDIYNKDIFDTNTIMGVFMFIFIFLILCGITVLGEVTRIPIFMFIAGFLGIFFGLLVFTTVSAVFGAVLVILSGLYMVSIFMR